MIIALSGKKRSGKDSFYSIVSEYVSVVRPDIPVIKFSFAGCVKEYAKTYFNVDVSEEEDKEKIRFVLQGIGQMMREEVDKNYWVRKVSDEIKECDRKYNEYVGIITDTRYKNEAKWAQERANHLIRIINPRSPVNDSHPSEVELDDFPFKEFIYNNGTLQEYQKAVIEWITRELK